MDTFYTISNELCNVNLIAKSYCATFNCSPILYYENFMLLTKQNFNTNRTL